MLSAGLLLMVLSLFEIILYVTLVDREYPHPTPRNVAFAAGLASMFFTGQFAIGAVITALSLVF